ncbi:MAG: hypothetical protein ACTS78_00055 [Arsenophonus sp. NC-WZS1-MAG3]
MPEGFNNNLECHLWFPSENWFIFLLLAYHILLPTIFLIKVKDSQAMHRWIIIRRIIMIILILKMYLIGVLGRAIFTEFNDIISDDHNINDYSFISLHSRSFLADLMAVIILIINLRLIQSSVIIIKNLYINITPKEIKIKN